MKILLTNIGLNNFTGSEMWTYTMAKELSKIHDVSVFSFNHGRVSLYMGQFAKMVDVVTDDYDLAIVNHIECLMKIPQGLFTIFTSHGVFGGHETAMPGADKYVAVTEEVKGCIKFPSTVIHNGIDCDLFKPQEAVRRSPENVLYLSNPVYASGEKIVRTACKGYNLIIIEKQRQSTKVYELINQADIVISFGRGALEGMACGRNVISADYRGYYMTGLRGGGMVTQENFDDLARDNFTGRTGANIAFTAETLRKEIAKYDPNRGEYLRNRILQDFNIKKTAQQYLDLYRGSNV